MDSNKDFMQIYGKAVSLASSHTKNGEIIDGVPADSDYNAHVKISTDSVTEDRSIWLYANSRHTSPYWGVARGFYSSVLLDDTGVSIEAGGQSEVDYNAGIYVYEDRISMTTCTYDELQYGTSNTDIYVLTPSFVVEGDFATNGTLFIQGTHMDDFVAYKGPSQVAVQNVVYEWNYNKWHSGDCELWCSIPVSNIDCNTALGTMFRTVEIVTPAFPFTVLSPNVVSSYESPGYGAILWPTGTTTTTTKPTNYYLVRPTSTTIVNGTINLQVKGKWK